MPGNPVVPRSPTHWIPAPVSRYGTSFAGVTMKGAITEIASPDKSGLAKMVGA